MRLGGFGRCDCQCCPSPIEGFGATSGTFADRWTQADGSWTFISANIISTTDQFATIQSKETFEYDSFTCAEVTVSIPARGCAVSLVMEWLGGTESIGGGTYAQIWLDTSGVATLTIGTNGTDTKSMRMGTRAAIASETFDYLNGTLRITTDPVKGFASAVFVSSFNKYFIFDPYVSIAYPHQNAYRQWGVRVSSNTDENEIELTAPKITSNKTPCEPCFADCGGIGLGPSRDSISLSLSGFKTDVDCLCGASYSGSYSLTHIGFANDTAVVGVSGCCYESAVQTGTATYVSEFGDPDETIYCWTRVRAYFTYDITDPTQAVMHVVITTCFSSNASDTNPCGPNSGIAWRRGSQQASFGFSLSGPYAVTGTATVINPGKGTCLGGTSTISASIS